MKKLLLGLMAIVGAVIATLGYERLFVERYFGPVAFVGLSVLLCFFIFILVSHRLYDTRFKEVIRGVWMVGISTLVAYFLLDLVAGVLFITPLSPPLVPDEYLHHKLVPNSLARLHQTEFSYIQRVNNLGMRGADIPVEKPAGQVRIAMLGDSFTMGKGVEDDQTFSFLVEGALNKAMAQMPSCKAGSVGVLNAGVDSYAPILQRLQLERDMGSLGLDLVVLNLDISDLVQEQAYRREAVRSAQGDIVGVPNAGERQSFTERMRVWIDHHLLFTRALLFYVGEAFGYRDVGIRAAVTQTTYETVAYTLEEDTENRDEQWADIFDSLLRIKEIANSRGADFVLSIYPWAHQISDTEWVPGRYSTGIKKESVPSDRRERILKEFAEKNGIIVADAFPAFRAYKGADPIYFKLDPHWTPIGQRVMAESLAAFVETNYLPGWCQ